MLQNGIATSLHKPLRRGCCSAYSECGDAVKPPEINISGALHAESAFVGSLAGAIKYSSVGTLLSANEENGIMALAELK